MEKRKIFYVFPFAAVGAITLASCGGGFNKISTDDAIKVAKYYDTRLSDVVMKNSDAKIHINTFGIKNGTGMLSYQKLDETKAIVGVDLSDLSFTAGSQDIVDLLLPNSLLNDANNIVNQSSKKSDDTFASLSYILSATVSESMIRLYSGALKDIYGVTEWKNMHTNFYSKKNSKGNDILQADIVIDSFTALKDEMVAAGMTGVDDVFKVLGDGTMNITVTCDDFGYVSYLGMKIKSNSDKKLSFKYGTQAAKGGGSLPSIQDIIDKKITPIGIDFEGEVDIDGYIEITHNAAEEYPFEFQRTSYSVETKEEKISYKKISTDTITDLTKDGVLEFNPYAPIKIDSLRQYYEDPKKENPSISYIYGPVGTAFEDNGYAVKIKIKTGEAGKESEWLLGNDYMYLGNDGKIDEPTLEKQCQQLLEFYNVDKVGVNPTGEDWSDKAQAYPYATLIVNGVRATTKTREECSDIGSDYCYFTIENPTASEYAAGQTPKSTDLYLVLHVGKDLIKKAKKSVGSSSPKFVVDLKVQKLK